MNRITNDLNTFLGNSNTLPASKTKAKDWQLEILMERLRSKASQYKSLAEISKNVRMTLLEKRYALDSVEKSQHQKCLDTLQHSIKVKSLQSMVERLESLTRQLGLKFVVESSGVFISSDMFYLEIVLDQTGAVNDVKIHHEGKMEQQSCMELVNCLSRGDFTDFTTQLEGFVSIYQLNAEKKIKCKAFTALESLENDLCTLAQLQSFMKEPFNLLYKSPVGILEKRRGGHPMRLTYFVSPYDLLNVEKNDIEPINVEYIISKNLGYNVTICMESSAAHKLQTAPLITVRIMSGISKPSYTPLTNQNSATIPACFILKLNKPMPMCLSLVRQIQQIQSWQEVDSMPVYPLLSLIVSYASDGKMESTNNKGLFVTLPDQNHCYFMTENKSMDGVLINSIPFTHPAHVAKILPILREQALFNTIISSCVRPNSRQDFENMTMLEIIALSSTHISISLEHPVEESMSTAEIDLSDISNLVCRIHNPQQAQSPDTAGDLGTKILNRTFSIPITMRSVIKLWEKQAMLRNHYSNNGMNENFSLPLGSGGDSNSSSQQTQQQQHNTTHQQQQPQQQQQHDNNHKNLTGGTNTEFGGLDNNNKLIKEQPVNLLLNHHQQQQAIFLNETIMSNANFTNFPPSNQDAVLTNLELTNILSGNTSTSSTTSTSSSTSMKQRQTKRKNVVEDLWKAGKRKVGSSTATTGDDSESSCDSTSRSTPLSSQDTEIPTPNSVLGFQSDLDISSLDTELIADKSQSGYDHLDEDVEEILTGTKRTTKLPEKSPNLLSDFGDKSLVPPSVSITPITSTSTSPNYNNNNNNNNNSSTSSDKPRPGIEIIPLANQSTVSLLPSSITITPISSSTTGGGGKSEEKSREKKKTGSSSGGSSRSYDEKQRLEKKRKRKRDESPMGPPDKVPPKQDPLTKPVSVSIKPAESPPLQQITTTTATPTSPSMIRKFNASPTQQNRTVVPLSGKLSPNLMKRSSPKHSPGHVSSSPKHIAGISSPKSSPKHPSNSSSGKPSMSTLKAANSPSSKSTSGDKIKLKESKERSKVLTVGVSGNKKSSSSSSSSLKVKSLDLNVGDVLQDNLPSPNSLNNQSGGQSANDLSKANNQQIRNRKGSLSAIVDKLKNAQHCDNITDLTNKTPVVSKSSQNASKSSSDSKSSQKLTSGETKNSEYMVKPSSDGMKITINKTRTKDGAKISGSKSSGSTSGSGGGGGSPKTHTGLKPGVNSGPASKKPQQQKELLNTTSSGSTNLTNMKTNTSNTKLNTKLSSNSTSNLSKQLSKLSNQQKTGQLSSSSSDLNRKKTMKIGGEKSIFVKDRKSSPTQPNRDESGTTSASDLYKFASPLMMEGMMKQLDKNFQIPKLSARTNTSSSSSSSTTTTTTTAAAATASVSDEKKPITTQATIKNDNLNNINRTTSTTSTVDTKIFDMITKNDISLPKYPLAISSKVFENSIDQKIRNSMNSLTNKHKEELVFDEKKKESGVQNAQGKDEVFKLDPISVPKTSSDPIISIPTSNNLDINVTKFITPAVPTNKDDKKEKLTNKETSNSSCSTSTSSASELLLDFSSNKSDKVTNSGNNNNNGGNNTTNSGTTITTTTTTTFPPQSPSVSVHIVKSPAPSPLINPSPHSTSSPCITDDELMDEALIGLGK